jgi:hypothetical protein
MIRWFRRWRSKRYVFRDIATMPHHEAAWLMRRCAAEGIGRQEMLLALSARALATAPDELRPLYMRWHAVYTSGRRVRITTAPATFNTVSVPDDLRREVEDAFNEGEH